ncbi:fumarylacetoacetate hydrolase family protein [Microbacterium sp. ARD31]|uniref:fumarylacetoacetate hydrolase family protein n=1 Tax=Microbacterium sp. ARD31 TaxID=2962576 RepID=UPI00288207CC|nr:fumarylacetoacetate hydrolase family protein [Microbacterium sp. ARD31]MDT0183988.1 fumarylacetoacetate hydrolase family protein [Microbacterium sp. ARD31]
MATQPWSLVQYQDSPGGELRAGVEAEGVVYALPEGFAPTTIEILRSWRRSEAALRALEVSDLAEVPAARLGAPITFPPKILCAGANYYDHAAEMGTAVPDPTARPFFFLKPPTTTVIGPDAGIPMPSGVDAGLDWEVELGVVIADRVKNVTEADALAHVAGYLVANDISARGIFPRPDAVMAPFAWDWFLHKALDGFCPTGPGLVPSWFVPDPADLAISLSVNGVMKQQSSTGNLVIGIARLISEASRFVTLEPGDLILTGTPAGVGMPRKDFLSIGDHMVAEIEGLGSLRTTVVA